jgi:hypothetical protein
MKSQPIARLAVALKIASAVAILVLIPVLLLGAVAAAALLRRAHLARRLTGLIALPAFLALLTGSGTAALLILADLVLTLLLVTLRGLLLLVAIGIVARLLIAISILLVRHGKSPRVTR